MVAEGRGWKCVSKDDCWREGKSRLMRVSSVLVPLVGLLLLPDESSLHSSVPRPGDTT